MLSWVNNDTRQGFSLEYPHISLHAISRDEQVHHRQCLYVMVDAKVDFPGRLCLLYKLDNKILTDCSVSFMTHIELEIVIMFVVCFLQGL